MVLSNHDEWTVTAKWLETQGIEGEIAIRAALKELKTLGYVTFERRGDGAIKGTWSIWTFYDNDGHFIQSPPKSPVGDIPVTHIPTGQVSGAHTEHYTDRTLLKQKTNEVELSLENESESQTNEAPKSSLEDLHNAWNEMAVEHGFPRCIVSSGKRRQIMAARLREKFFADNWAKALVKIPQTPFLTGKNERGWKADFDWFLKPESVIRIMEGKYQSTKSNANNGNVKPDHKNGWA